MKKVIIIGGGASGLMAGIMAAREGALVTILEKCEKPGKKLLATGNGRCNLTNLAMDASCYHGDSEMIRQLLANWSAEDTLAFFQELGLWTKSREGWIYPRTDQASSVLAILLQEYTRLKGKLKTLEEVTEIRKAPEGFTVYTKGWHYEADAVIVACGTPASNIEGVSDQALKLAEDFGLSCKSFRPSLVPLRCRREQMFAKWAGVRTRAALKLYSGTELLQTEEGEVQLTDYGISGIPVFQLSALSGELLEKGRPAEVEMNFLPDLDREELDQQIAALNKTAEIKKPEQILIGLLPDRLLSAFCGKKTTLEEVLNKACCCRLTISGTGSPKQAQICAGGVLLSELTKDMEAKSVPGLFFTGECTDADGRCGGYNLQWAWSTGAAAGKKSGRLN